MSPQAVIHAHDTDPMLSVARAPALVFVAVARPEPGAEGHALARYEQLLQRPDLCERDALVERTASVAPWVGAFIEQARLAASEDGARPLQGLREIADLLEECSPQTSRAMRLWLYSLAVAVVQQPRRCVGERISNASRVALKEVAEALRLEL